MMETYTYDVPSPHVFLDRSVVSDHFKFTGKERDSESGLDNFGARYDSSSIGRFMTPDPLGGHYEDPQTLNKYAYVRNNPTTLTDPTGRYSSAQDLALDVARYLDGAPVEAYPENLFRKAGRLISRHRVAILLVAAYLVMRVLLLYFMGR
jgi:RHS repeat-associated protein